MFSLLVNNHKFNIFVLWDGIYILFIEEHIQIKETLLFLVENACILISMRILFLIQSVSKSVNTQDLFFTEI